MPLSTVARIILYAVLINLTAKGLLEARSLKRRHGHHRPHLDQNDPEKQAVPRKLSSLRRLENLDTKNRDFVRRSSNNEPHKNKRIDGDDLKSLLRPEIRKKRHGSVTYRKITEEDKKQFLNFKKLNNQWIGLLNNQNNGARFNEYYELEVKEAQNSSICSYTVVEIPDARGTRIPSELEHVICNHVGSSCHTIGSYCCVQTYRKVEIRYTDDVSKEIMKVYAGCVCAHQVLKELTDTEETLPIND